MHATEGRGDRRVRLLSVATAFLLLLSLIGLATHDAGDAAAEQVSAAAEATTSTGTAVIELRMQMKAGTSDVTITGVGVVDFVADRASLTLTTPGRQPVEFVVDGETVYQRDPNLPASGGKPWVVVPTGPVGGLSPAAAGSGGDPLATLRMLEDDGLLRDVRHDGDDEVGGVQAARYTAAVDGDKLRERVGDLRPELAAMARAVRVNDTAVAVWVSDDGLLRRVETTVSMTVGEQSFDMSTGFDLRDFGAPARIEVPPPDQVTRPAG